MEKTGYSFENLILLLSTNLIILCRTVSFEMNKSLDKCKISQTRVHWQITFLIHYRFNFGTYSRSSSIAISICSFSIVNVICSVDYPNSRWSHCNLYSFSSNVLPVLSSPSIDILIFVDSPNMTVVTDIKLEGGHVDLVHWTMIQTYIIIRDCSHIMEAKHQSFGSIPPTVSHFTHRLY